MPHIITSPELFPVTVAWKTNPPSALYPIVIAGGYLSSMTNCSKFFPSGRISRSAAFAAASCAFLIIGPVIILTPERRSATTRQIDARTTVGFILLIFILLTCLSKRLLSAPLLNIGR